MRAFVWSALFTFFVSSAWAGALEVVKLGEVSVPSFESLAPESCRPTDVPLNSAQVLDFFRRATQIDSRRLHDDYDLAPCYLKGSLKYRARFCEWEVRAGATGVIRCASQEQYFACDSCTDLFPRTATE